LFTIEEVDVNKFEFISRYRFNPYLKNMNPSNAKNAALSSLIAEKLLYVDAKAAFSAPAAVDQIIQQYQKEAMIEQVKIDSVEQFISISHDELWREYLKSLKEIEIEYIAFESMEKAKYYKQKITNSGNFAAEIRNYMDINGWEDEKIPTKNIRWATEPQELEDVIYSLPESVVSEPVSAFGDFYLIRVTNVLENDKPSEYDFFQKKSAIESKIREYKIQNSYKQFFENNIRNHLPDIFWKPIHHTANLLANSYDFLENSDNKNSKEVGPLKTPDQLEHKSSYYHFKDSVALDFKNGITWTIEQLLNKLKIGPYAFNFRDAIRFKRSFAKNVQLLAEHETLYHFALSQGYEDNPKVVEQTDMWASYFLANSHRYQILTSMENENFPEKKDDSESYSHLTGLEKNRLLYMDSYLSSLLNKYDISINERILLSIKNDKNDMVVKKTHFANRLVAPPLEPLNGLPKWNKAIHSLFSEIGL
jgi:hypothetical protein